MTEVTNTAAMEGSATANSHRRSQYDFFNSTEKDYIKKLARSWYELPTKRRNSRATRKHHAAVHDGTCNMSDPCQLHAFQHIRHAF